MTDKVITGLKTENEGIDFDLAVAKYVFGYESKVCREGYKIQYYSGGEWRNLPHYGNPYGVNGDASSFMLSNPGYLFKWYVLQHTVTLRIEALEGQYKACELEFERTSISMQIHLVVMCYLVMLKFKGVDIEPFVSYKEGN